MKKLIGILSFVLILVTSGLILSGSGYNELGAPSYVIKNGTVWNGIETIANATIVISGKNISDVIINANAESLCTGTCKIINAENLFVMPGFHDSHAHLASGGSEYYRLIVSGSSVEKIQTLLDDYCQKNPDLNWIIGSGWSTAGFNNHYPTSRDLDLENCKVPVVLGDSDGHAIWVNTLAMKVAGINNNTPTPEGGQIVRDTAGEPTGVFLESAADLIYQKMPGISKDEYLKYVAKGQEVGIAAGVSAWTGGSVTPLSLKYLLEFQKNDKLKLRSYVWADLDLEDSDFEDLLEVVKSIPRDSLIQFVGFKGFVDGVISSFTGALLLPYSDRLDTSGALNYEQKTLNKFVLRANSRGYEVFLHAIGDKAVRSALDAYEYSQKKIYKSIRNRIEHVEVVSPKDIPRFKKLNVVASVQPSHIHWDTQSENYYPARLGAERIPFSFLWKSFLSSGARITFGTDWPVVSWDPIEGIYCAVNRSICGLDAFSKDEGVDVETALRGFTVFPAESISQGSKLGKIQPGYYADILILGKDPRSFQTKSGFNNRPIHLFINGVKVK